MNHEHHVEATFDHVDRSNMSQSKILREGSIGRDRQRLIDRACLILFPDITLFDEEKKFSFVKKMGKINRLYNTLIMNTFKASNIRWNIHVKVQ